jgi:hypothetical protein
MPPYAISSADLSLLTSAIADTLDHQNH